MPYLVYTCPTCKTAYTKRSLTTMLTCKVLSSGKLLCKFNCPICETKHLKVDRLLLNEE